MKIIKVFYNKLEKYIKSDELKKKKYKEIQ